MYLDERQDGDCESSTSETTAFLDTESGIWLERFRQKSTAEARHKLEELRGRLNAQRRIVIREVEMIEREMGE